MLTPEKGERWGILGGTFDPVHYGHITLAKDIYSKKKLNGILLIPAFNHPLKNRKILTSFEDRLEMLRLATEEYNFFVISEIEKEQSLSGYTLDTLKAVKYRYPDVDFYFIIGADNIEQIKNWHCPDEIAKEMKIVAGSRPFNGKGSLINSLAGKIEYIETSLIDISSSEIRALFQQGGTSNCFNEWVEKKVIDYIIKNRLYQ